MGFIPYAINLAQTLYKVMHMLIGLECLAPMFLATLVETWWRSASKFQVLVSGKELHHSYDLKLDDGPLLPIEERREAI